MNMRELRAEMRRVMAASLEIIQQRGQMRLAVCHVYTKTGVEILAIDMPKPGAPRDVVRGLICARIIAGDIHAIVFTSETWQAHCSLEERPLVDQWRQDHDGSLEGSPWTRDVLMVIGSCPDGEPHMLACEFDAQRRPGPIEERDYRVVNSRFTGNLPWPQRIEKHRRS